MRRSPAAVGGGGPGQGPVLARGTQTGGGPRREGSCPPRNPRPLVLYGLALVPVIPCCFPSPGDLTVLVGQPDINCA